MHQELDPTLKLLTLYFTNFRMDPLLDCQEPMEAVEVEETPDPISPPFNQISMSILHEVTE